MKGKNKVRRKTWLPLWLVAVLLAASCGGGSPASPPAVAPEVPPNPTPARVAATTAAISTTTTTAPPVTSTSAPADVYTQPTLPVPELPVSVSDVPWSARERLSAGVNYSCGLYERDDAVECWYWEEPFRPTLKPVPKSVYDYGLGVFYDYDSGVEYIEESYDYWGEPSVQTPKGGFAAVDAGREAACGIRPDGELECWGASPLASVPPPGGEFVSVSVGIEHACALRPGGQAECWGTSSRWAGAVFPPGGEFTSISAGDDFVCGLRPLGGVECWGNGFKRFGKGEQLPPLGAFKAVSAGGGGHVCGLRLDNSVECWGDYDIGSEVVRGGTYLQPPEGEFASISLGSH